MQSKTTETARSILVPVDFSAVSRIALLFAVQLAQCSSVPLIVLHVAYESLRRKNGYPRTKDVILPIEEIAEGMLHDFMADIRNEYPDNDLLVEAGLVVVSGLPATRIPEIARQTGAGLIVMGGDGRTRLKKLITGSVSGSVIRHTPVPVTIVHANGTHHAYPGTSKINSNGEDLLLAG